jgi:hypothetical protein
LCFFCSDPESVNHLFFDCFVAKLVWPVISKLLNIEVGQDFESIARWWVSNVLLFKVCSCCCFGYFLVYFPFLDHISVCGSGVKTLNDVALVEFQ